MLSVRGNILYTFSLIFIRPAVSQLGQPQNVPQSIEWSTKSYGPDGPWNAVSIQIGTPAQSIDLLPGGSWTTNLLAPTVCVLDQPCYASEAGFYNSTASSTNYQTSFTGSVDNTTINPSTVSTVFGSANWEFDTTTISIRNGIAGALYTGTFLDFDLLVITDGFSTLPNGTRYSPTIGALALGGPNFNETWDNVRPYPWNGTLLTSSLFAQGHAPSNSYGMHIGSTAMAIPGSLNVGGYDQSRVLGPVSSQPYSLNTLPIDLLDIGIGVAEGGSPFNFTSATGLLASGNASIGVSIPVFVESRIPYLYLPQSTCDSIAQNLPVTFQKDLGLYFWDIHDPRYDAIITSPAFLSFTFRLSLSTSQNFTIKMPFSLLNLTLTAPLAQAPTAYFPCSPGQGVSGRFTLGRAFMQAAFVGVNWIDTGDGNWFLAQAPGPNIPSTAQATVIDEAARAINGSTDNWEDSWKGAWKVIADSGVSNSSTGLVTTNSPTNTTAVPGEVSNHSSISKLGMIGIVIAGVVVCIGLFAGGLYWYRRRATGAIARPVSTQLKSELHAEPPKYAGGSNYLIGEMGAESRLVELYVNTNVAEMYGDRKVYSRPVEMAA